MHALASLETQYMKDGMVCGSMMKYDHIPLLLALAAARLWTLDVSIASNLFSSSRPRLAFNTCTLLLLAFLALHQSLLGRLPKGWD